MLRLLHTADWHLGQTFHGYDRDEEHARFLEWLLAILATEQPDALLVAGDVFDTVNPSALAQRRFYDFLARAQTARPGLQLILTAGNHDAAARLEAPAALLAAFKITVVGTVPRTVEGLLDPGRMIMPVANAAGQVEALVLAVPFLRPSDVPEKSPVAGVAAEVVLGAAEGAGDMGGVAGGAGEGSGVGSAADAYLDGIRELYRQVSAEAERLRETRYPGAALVALGHCHVQGSAESRDSERRLIIGGSEALRLETFPPALSYVALGHIHRPQSFAGGRIRYCGSPLPLSFTEKDYSHAVLRVELADGRLTGVTALPIPRTVALLRVPAQGAASLDGVLQAITELRLRLLPPGGSAAVSAPAADAPFPFVEVHVLDDGPQPQRRAMIEAALKDLPVRLTAIRLHAPVLSGPGGDGAGAAVALPDLSALDPETILVGAYRERYPSAPEPAPGLLVAWREILLAERTGEPTAV